MQSEVNRPEERAGGSAARGGGGSDVMLGSANRRPGAAACAMTFVLRFSHLDLVNFDVVHLSLLPRPMLGRGTFKFVSFTRVYWPGFKSNSLSFKMHFVANSIS